jgi:hypothetical protein
MSELEAAERDCRSGKVAAASFAIGRATSGPMTSAALTSDNFASIDVFQLNRIAAVCRNCTSIRPTEYDAALGSPL